VTAGGPGDRPVVISEDDDAPLAPGGLSAWREAVVATALPWCVARVAVLCGVVLATVASDQLGVGHPAPLEDGLLAWDAHQYRAIAEDGYQAIPHGFRFFPGMPLLSRGLGWLLAGHVDVAMILLANLAAFAAGVALYRLVLVETGQARLSRLSTWLLLATPGAAPFAMGYAESIGVLGAVLAFLAVRTGRWRIAALPALAVGLTWSIGALLALPLAVEAVRTWRTASPVGRLWRALTAAAPVAATASYLAWVQHETGSWYRDVFEVQDVVYHRGFEEPIGRIIESARDLVAGHHPQGIQFLWVLLVIPLLVVTFRRLPLSYGVWSLAIFLIGISAHNIDSFERYLLRAFPLVIAGALSIRSEKHEWAVVSLSLAGLVVYSTAILVGARVP
jgi:hypothetical protein